MSLYRYFLVFLLIVSAASSAYSQWSIQQITDNSYEDCYFDLNDNGSIAWVGRGVCDYTLHADMEIYLYDGTDIERLTNNSDVDTLPKINNNGYVTWDGLGNILLYNGNTTIALSDEPIGTEMFPKINNRNHVIWRQYYHGDEPTTEIFYHDGTSGQNISNNPFGDTFSKINDNDYIVWNSFLNGEDAEILLYNGSEILQLTDNETTDRYPRINNNNYIVWEHWDSGATDIYMYDGSSIIDLTDYIHYQATTCRINNNNQVIWLENRFYEWGVWNHVVVINDGIETKVISGENYESDKPDINDSGQVVWQGFDGNDWEIFAYDGTTVQQLTDNCHDDTWPLIGNNGHVAWQGFDGNDHEIYRAVPVTSLAPTSWASTYGGSGDETGTSIVQTYDGGYIMTGTAASIGGQDIWVVKTDPEGNPQWQRTYGGAGEESAIIRQTEDGGYIMAGTTDSFGAGGTDIWLIKIDSTGDTQWQFTFGGPGDEQAADIREHACIGGYILAGTTTSFGAGLSDMWLLKISTDGAIVWQKTYGTEEHEIAASVIITGDGSYVVAGQAWSHTFGSNLNADFLVMKLDGLGNVQWQKIHGESNVDTPRALQQTIDGGFIVAGESISLEYGLPYSHIRVLMLDGGGNVTRHTSYGALLRREYPTDIHQSLDGGFILSGYREFGELLTYTNAWCMKLNYNGTISWQTTISETGKYDSETAEAVFPSNDGGFVITGTTDSTGMGGKDLFLAKFNGIGEIDDCTWGTANDLAAVSAVNATENIDLTITEPDAVRTPTLAFIKNTASAKNNPCGPFEIPGILNLPKTGQTQCYDESGTVIDCINTGQDGQYMMGVDWPDPRFNADPGDGTLQDRLTGLIWSPDVSSPTVGTCVVDRTWQGALDHVACLNSEAYLGHSDWRVPNIIELMSLYHYGTNNPQGWLVSQGFDNFRYPTTFWSSTFGADLPLSGQLNAWIFYLSYTIPSQTLYPANYSQYLWPVRGPDLPGTIELPKTGQTECYTDNVTPVDCSNTGQDGELQMGLTSPEPRFIKNSNATTTDRLTGLIWTRDAQLTSHTIGSCRDGYTTGQTDWQMALDWIACINAENMLGHSDWRLPNVNEMSSLINFSETEPPLPTGHPFENFATSCGGEEAGYWTSTSGPRADKAWIVDFCRGLTLTRNKTWPDYYVLPVRGGHLQAGICPEDSDCDGLPDSVEDANGNDIFEPALGETDLFDADTDDDGILDGTEDANQNGIVDSGETNPCINDTDGDGIQDGTELGLTFDDIGADTDTNIFQPDLDPVTQTDPLNMDSDGDGYSDGDEDKNYNGRVDAGESNPDDVASKPSRAMPWIPLLLLN